MFYEELGTNELVQIYSIFRQNKMFKKTFFQYNCSSNQIEIPEKQMQKS